MKLIGKMNQSILMKNLTVFSDGSLLLEINVAHKKQKSFQYIEKDLKKFQLGVYKNFLNTLIKSSNTKFYRKKLFK